MIFTTGLLPVEVQRQADGTYKIWDSFISSNQMFYYIRKYLHKIEKFTWVGCMINEDVYEEKNRLRNELYTKHCFWPIFITKHEYDVAYLKVFRGYFSKIFSVSYVRLID